MRPHKLENQSPAAEFPASAPLIDSYARRIDYIRLSVTDRCDFRCVYCMSENMNFLPKADLLTLEELERLSAAFVARGVHKIRITGGEPLVRRNIMQLFRGLARLFDQGLRELTLTTNGSQLARFAQDLADCGVRRVNVSLDTLDPEKFRAITRWGDMARVLDGIEAARAAGLKVKINCVALKGVNEDEFLALVEWAHDLGMEVSFIEAMPLGEDAVHNIESFLPLDVVTEALSRRLTLSPSTHASGGPARFFDVAETGGRVGFITPLSQHFCDSCNRVRVTCTGALYTCLGQEDRTDLRGPLRASMDGAALHAALDDAMRRKPRGHDFVAQWSGALAPSKRPMSMTGG
ncbi:GTP 3',8-cyclase MoaA [Rhodoblastus acidophilus]|uniref:GTP 3',8-cyclase n=1 Tax=Candidatus Rhodoblastus alkanivorans TaxID=2954117 RepID=A0ABS9ZAD0_9HYPH|nr:GTP 3',8-cyclase MoaA [Candidatus Rhodoblastus alkanivorans]MCI4680820.1 GTP 3',8-cyclase MoaA [Candidatus Rhodoblastus alkanivorans]MCI4684381.1 GTP 3',8-cyclase MoaA [Candidatus Rhodoblastus alkanivorans]MDI4641702.1 GTP 3',8-cyclase MoaA [Rhodoblastus acidophilus]